MRHDGPTAPLPAGDGYLRLSAATVLATAAAVIADHLPTLLQDIDGRMPGASGSAAIARGEYNGFGEFRSAPPHGARSPPAGENGGGQVSDTLDGRLRRHS
ncbi:hypothetical protein [Sphingomonas lacusdianchii]|uniref:hypothetical protein n=1 Tax=Sphingomonas lacusdianchii TaxID=2917992 RepID=UPI001F599D65|nr:hypothetical protein [Sphingomonas sp. JXJ CY 53]